MPGRSVVPAGVATALEERDDRAEIGAIHGRERNCVEPRSGTEAQRLHDSAFRRAGCRLAMSASILLRTVAWPQHARRNLAALICWHDDKQA